MFQDYTIVHQLVKKTSIINKMHVMYVKKIRLSVSSVDKHRLQNCVLHLLSPKTLPFLKYLITNFSYNVTHLDNDRWIVHGPNSAQYTVWKILTLILLTRRIWWAPYNASKWQMGFNSAFKGLKSMRITTFTYFWVFRVGEKIYKNFWSFTYV